MLYLFVFVYVCISEFLYLCIYVFAYLYFLSCALVRCEINVVEISAAINVCFTLCCCLAVGINTCAGNWGRGRESTGRGRHRGCDDDDKDYDDDENQHLCWELGEGNKQQRGDGGGDGGT